MKIYTRTGDDGTTGLMGGVRTDKDDLRIQTYGTVDEISACIGLARALGAGALDGDLASIQTRLFVLGAELAWAPERARRRGQGIDIVSAADVTWMERTIDRLEAKLPPLRSFILPAGSPAACALHVARAVCRRAERVLVALARRSDVSALSVRFLNRLSDLLFVMARSATHARGLPETPWQPPRPGVRRSKRRAAPSVTRQGRGGRGRRR